MKDYDYNDFAINYKIHSSLGCIENSRYNQEIIGEINYIDEDSNIIEKAGEITANKLLLGVGIDNGWDAHSIFDNEGHLFEIGESIYDFSENDWQESINEYYHYDIHGLDVLILSRIEILPKYRSNSIAKYAIKDLYNNFSSNAGLFVLKCFPIQFEAGILEKRNEWQMAMDYDKMEKDIEKATYKLLAFYKQLGFELIPAVGDELMFINTAVKNKKFDEILLE